MFRPLSYCYYYYLVGVYLKDRFCLNKCLINYCHTFFIYYTCEREKNCPGCRGKCADYVARNAVLKLFIMAYESLIQGYKHKRL